MTEKDLLRQLNKLQSVKANADFKLANRQLLVAQITQGEAVDQLNVWARFNVLMGRLFQPYAIAAMIVLFFIASGVYGFNLSKQSKPGDSLYLAKKLSERTKMFVAFNDDAKNKLNLQFASSRVAELDSLTRTGTSDAQESLKNDFKNEISQVKSRLAKNNPATSNKQDGFISADEGKDNTKIDVSVPDSKKASSTPATDNVGEVLEEAEKLVDTGAYSQAANKLDEANKLIDVSK